MLPGLEHSSTEAAPAGHGFTSVGARSGILWHCPHLNPVKHSFLFTFRFLAFGTPDFEPIRHDSSLSSWKMSAENVDDGFDVDGAVGFDRAFGAIESNCPSTSKPSSKFSAEIVHEERDESCRHCRWVRNRVYRTHSVTKREPADRDSKAVRVS